MSRVFTDARPWRTTRRRADAKLHSANASRRHHRPGPFRSSTASLDVSSTAAPPVYVSTTYCPWRRLDVETFRQELRRSALCCSEIVPKDVDSMADLYNSELNAIVDRLLPLRTSTRRSRRSDPWFDDDCRNAKRRCRHVERRARRSSAARTAW